MSENSKNEILEQRGVLFKGLAKICQETASKDNVKGCLLIEEKGVLGEMSIKEALGQIAELSEDPEIKKILKDFQTVAPSQTDE